MTAHFLQKREDSKNITMYQTLGYDDQIMHSENDGMTIEAMLQQESSGYLVPDFLATLPASTPLGEPLDIFARQKIAEWCLTIMEVCGYHSETAEIAINYLDRFASSGKGRAILLDRKEYQLAALTAVYTAAKVHEQQALTPRMIAKLSNGERTAVDIERMELRMLQAIQWRMHPPTSSAFVRHYLDLIPNDIVDSNTRKVILELSQIQINSSLSYYEFCTEKASQVAFAALLNAVESVDPHGKLFDFFSSSIAICNGIESKSMILLRERLYEKIASKGTSSHVPKLPTLRKPTCAVQMNTNFTTGRLALSPRTVQLS